MAGNGGAVGGRTPTIGDFCEGNGLQGGEGGVLEEKVVMEEDNN